MEETIFHKIIAGTSPADKVYEDERVLVIKNIRPLAPVHLLLLPKKKAISSIKELSEEDRELVGNLFLVAKKVAEEQGLAGYKLVFNVGREGGQEIDYLHLHLLGGWEKGSGSENIAD